MVTALTGATGKLGGETVKILQNKGLNLRYLVRNPNKLKNVEKDKIFKAAYNCDEDTVNALKGVDVLFMVSAGDNEKRLGEPQAFVDAAGLAGVHHIVYSSFYNVSPECTFTLGRDHYHTEEYIKEKGFKYTFLRDNFYLDFFVDMCMAYGELRGPAGDGKVSAVVRSDVSEVAAKILENPGLWENKVLNMTGPIELTLGEIADIVGKKLGKDIPYISETLKEAYESRKKWNAPDWEMESWVSTYTAIAKGEQAGVSTDIEKILGRPATSIFEFVEK